MTKICTAPFTLALAIIFACGIDATHTDNDALVQALLAKHRAYVGWQLGDGAFKSLRMTRLVLAPDGSVRQRMTELRIGAEYRVFRASAEGEGYLSDVFWRSNENGFVTPIQGQLAQLRLAYNMLVNEGTSSLSGAFIGSEMTTDGTVDIIRLKVPGAADMDVYINPISGAYTKAIINPGGDRQLAVEILSYLEVLPGKRIIGSFRLGKTVLHTAYVSVEPDTQITEQDLKPPPPRASWTFRDTKPIPIVVTPYGIAVDMVVNGVKGRFIIDTGSEAIFMTQTFADTIRLPSLGRSGTATSLNGTAPVQARLAASIEIGGNRLSNVIVQSEDFSAMKSGVLSSGTIDGLLGFDLFAGAVVGFDFKDRSMTIGQSAADISDKGLDVPLESSSWIPGIPIVLNGSIRTNGLLDLGTPSELVVGSDLLQTTGLTIEAMSAPSASAAHDCGILGSIEIANVTFKRTVVCVRRLAFIRGSNVLVGLALLQHFRIVFDYRNGRVFLQTQ